METKPLIERLAALIHTLRERGGPTQAEIAARLSISDGQLSSQLSGRNSPSVERVEAIAGATGHYLELLTASSAARIATLQTRGYANRGYTAGQIVELALYELQRQQAAFEPADGERYLQARKKELQLATVYEVQAEIRFRLSVEPPGTPDRFARPQLTPKQRARLERQLIGLNKEAETLTAEIAALLAGLAPE